MSDLQKYWRKCSVCKKEIPLNSKYFDCSVSTCTGQRTGYVFCSVSCWEVHLPGAKHRSAGAIEKKSPSESNTTEPTSGPVRRIVTSAPSVSEDTVSSQLKKSSIGGEVLVVVSKMKQYIRDISDMNTSEEVNYMLSDMIRTACDTAVKNARADGRKTVMARDFKK